MSKEITELVQQCHICNLFQNNNRTETLLPHEIAEYPWQQLGMDFMGLNKNLYLIVIDYYPQFPELIKINNTKANTLIVQLKSMFATYGIPEIIFSDNGSPFQSKEFQEFCDEWSMMVNGQIYG